MWSSHSHMTFLICSPQFYPVTMVVFWGADCIALFSWVRFPVVTFALPKIFLDMAPGVLLPLSLQPHLTSCSLTFLLSILTAWKTNCFLYLGWSLLCSLTYSSDLLLLKSIITSLRKHFPISWNRSNPLLECLLTCVLANYNYCWLFLG